MVNIKFFFLLSFTLLFFSCSEREQQNLNNKASLEKRTDTDCGFCEEIKVEVNYSPTIDDCCKAEVYIKSTTGTKDCKQMIFVNGEFLQFIDQDLTVLNYFVCPSQPTVVRVMGFDETTGEFTKVCYEERLNCKGCCENVTYQAYSCGKINDSGCCAYSYTFYNQSSCPMYLYNAEGNAILTLPVGSTINNNFTACANDPSSLKYVIGKSATETCKEITLSTDCGEACKCGTSTILVKQLKNVFLKGCCRYNITAYNRSNCTLYLFSSDGSVLATILPGGVFKTSVEECGAKTYYLGSNPNPNSCGVCTSASIKCGK